MTNEKFAVTEQLLLLKKLYPQYARAIDSALEDVEDLETLSEGSVYSRIFRAIADGYHLRTEISQKTGLEKEDLKKYLTQMVKAGTLRIEQQGGKTEGARGARKLLYFLAEKASIQTTAAESKK